MISLYPLAANLSANAFPNPEVAPVINTVFGMVEFFVAAI
jgi:hypothetical protein